ncbi:hypothetical protein [Oryza sativa Japonica Group]|uniref:Retrotransposon, putative, centromere-specific n=1 Tax=Oryza sativa subsp. japonica TaxID=39947 RepID=Q5QLR9_ORYSJ|nr:hypothetical protein [Oryza sativa Japonica Group]BAD73686.1 hypothetical protein [Oryza sativa Japonica Group]
MATTDATIAHIMDEQEDIKIKSSNLFSEFHLVWPESQEQGAASPIMGLWACNFIWDPGPGIRLICTGKINNPRRGVSIAKAQRNVLYGCNRVVNVFSTNRSYHQLTERSGQTTALSVERNSGFIRKTL